MGSSLCLIIRSCAHTSVPVSDKFTFFTFQENMWNTILFITLVIAKSEMLTLTQSILHFRTPSGHWGQDIDGLSVIFLGKHRSVVYHKLCHFLSSQSKPQKEPRDSSAQKAWRMSSREKLQGERGWYIASKTKASKETIFHINIFLRNVAGPVFFLKLVQMEKKNENKRNDAHHNK